jgi:hypothetical protein
MLLVFIISLAVFVLTLEQRDNWLEVVNPFAGILAFGGFLTCLPQLF